MVKTEMGGFKYCRPLVPLPRGFARGAELTEVYYFSIAVDLPSLKLWQGKEDGDGKQLSPRTKCGDGKSNTLRILICAEA